MPSLDEMLEGRPGAVQATTRDLCRFVLEVIDDAEMRISEDRVAFHLGGPLCLVQLHEDHVRFAVDQDDAPVRLRSFGELDHEDAVLRLNRAERRLAP